MNHVWATGDIHGEIDYLKRTLAYIDANREPEDVEVYLGDYIDRGPDSAAVVEALLARHEARPEQTVLLWGNHEDMAAEALGQWSPIAAESANADRPETGFGLALTSWLHNGGDATLESFGCGPRDACPPALARLFPLLRPWWRDAAGMIYVHAGLRHGVPPEEESATNLLWLRPVQCVGQPSRPYICGHTPQGSISSMFRLGKAIIDGGCGKGAGGVLWTLLVVGGRVAHLHGERDDYRRSTDHSRRELTLEGLGL